MFGWFKKRKNDDPKEALHAALGDFQLPAFPKVASEALAMLRDPSTPLSAIGDRLSEDPHLSAKVLLLANSSAFALRHPVKNVAHAVSLLGRSAVESVAIAVVVQRALPKPAVRGFDPAQFWTSAARRAPAARGLSDLLHPHTRAESFSASLLSDMSVPLIAQAHPDVYGEVLTQWNADGGSLGALEIEALGFDHASIAGWVADRWQFPELLTNAIGSHHDESVDDGVPPAVRLVSELDELDLERATERLIETVHRDFGVERDTVQRVVADAHESAGEIARRLV